MSSVSTAYWMKRSVLAAAAIGGLGLGPALGQTATIQDNQLLVDRQSHWEEWHFPPGTVEVEGGAVRPHYVSKNIDATGDIVAHLKRNPGNKDPEEVTLLDAIEAGVNKGDVANLFDDDESTYWEPGIGSPLGEWWFQVDLGRLVSARRIVLKFAGEGEGDPFLQFVVLTSDGRERIKGVHGFHRAFQTRHDNKEQRVFDIELQPTRTNVEKDFRGDMVRIVQVVVTASDGERGARVTAEEHSLLDDDDRGAADYYRKVADGEVRVSQASHESISSDDRGSVRHYRRERPRLAELELISVGENLALGIKNRGGIALDYLGESIFTLIDGDFASLKNINAGDPGIRRRLFFDLNSSYWVDTFQAYYNTFRASFGNFMVQTSDGTLAPDGSLAWVTQATETGGNESPGADAYEFTTFAPVPARYVQILYWSPSAGTEYYIPRELQLFGEGYQPEVELVTADPIRLGESLNLVSVEWDATTPPGSRVEIQTRTGNRLAEKFLYYNKSGVEVTEEAYRKLGFFSRGDSVAVFIPGPDWSSWSRPYRVSGERITSPSPRSSLMMRARLLSSDPQAGATLEAVRLNFVEPVAAQLQGEVVPAVVEALGVEQEFSLFVKIGDQADPFDEILLEAPASIRLQFSQLLVGRESQWETEDVRRVADSELRIVSTDPDSLWVQLDEPVLPGSADLIELQFTSALYAPGAVLTALLGNSSRADSWQRVDAGDATTLAAGDGMVVVGPIGGHRVLGEVDISSSVMTPNGDGVNDETTFGFPVINLTGRQEVEVRIYDLSGRLVNRISEERPQVSGEYEISWNGRGAGGGTVVPGIYLVAIEVDTDDAESVGNAVTHRLVHVVH